jgi:hypothetical protein
LKPRAASLHSLPGVGADRSSRLLVTETRLNVARTLPALVSGALLLRNPPREALRLQDGSPHLTSTPRITAGDQGVCLQCISLRAGLGLSLRRDARVRPHCHTPKGECIRTTLDSTGQ